MYRNLNNLFMLLSLILLFCTVSACTLSSYSNAKDVPMDSVVHPLNAKEGEVWVLDESRSDEFTGDSIDTSKWKAQPKHVQTWTWDNEKNVAIKDGNLLIQMVYKPHKRPISNPCEQGRVIPNSQLYFTSGMLESHNSGIFGYYEARIKGVQKFPGFSPAFWMYSKFDDSQLVEGSVRYSEIDVVEMQQRQDFQAGNELITDHNLHTALTKKNAKPNPTGRAWRRPGKFHEQENVHRMAMDPGEHFHTYAVRVDKDEIVWYVDDEIVGRADNNYWRQLNMSVALSLGLRKPFTEFTCNGFSPLDPYKAIAEFDSHEFNSKPPTMTVDYVRVWTLE